MSVTTFSQLPEIFALSGQELFMISQPQTPPISPAVPWVSYAVTAQVIKNFAQGIPSTSQVTMRQLKQALSAQSVIIEVYQALPADIADGYNIAWASASNMTLTDPFTLGFLQPTLGYSNAQMQALFLLALTFPA